MVVDPAIQAEFERNLMWKRSWPRCFFSLASSLEISACLVIFLTECLNIVAEFWHTNVFGGIWASLIIFINWILISVTICCTTTVGASTCAFVWNIVTLLTVSTLLTFDIIFILDPTTCILTPTCATQPQVISLNSLIQLIPAFKNYTASDSKKLLLEIQAGAAGAVFIISALYIIIFLVCKAKLRQRVASGH